MTPLHSGRGGTEKRSFYCDFVTGLNTHCLTIASNPHSHFGFCATALVLYKAARQNTERRAWVRG